MAFKLIVIASLLAYVNAGILGSPAVATYSAAPLVSSAYIQQAPLAVAHAAQSVAIHNPTYGSSHQSVERSLGGAQSISHYSKAIDSAFSTVRKYDTRITNDGLAVAHAPVATYGAPLVTKSISPIAYSGPAISYSSAPSVSSAYLHQPQPQLLAKAVAPLATYAAPAPVAYTAQAPVAYAAPAPIATYAAPAPLLTKSVAAPVLSAYSAPVVTKAAVAYSPATVVAHTTFTGLGTAYEW